MATTTTTARTNYGSLRGVAEDEVVIFRGIPYARPPVGHLRFAPPQPPDDWTGTRDATVFGPRAARQDKTRSYRRESFCQSQCGFASRPNAHAGNEMYLLTSTRE